MPNRYFLFGDKIKTSMNIKIPRFVPIFYFLLVEIEEKTGARLSITYLSLNLKIVNDNSYWSSLNTPRRDFFISQFDAKITFKLKLTLTYCPSVKIGEAWRVNCECCARRQRKDFHFGTGIPNI